MNTRVRSLDVVRGIVMVLMAIDHVRVYSGLPAGGPTAGIFFTRWITHFCAPAFCFFAGTSAYLYARSGRKVASFLLSRGLLLVVLELTFIRFTWTFNFDYEHFTLAGVIWMLGWCMILLAALVRLPAKFVGAIGLAIVSFQQVFHHFPHSVPQVAGWIWEFIYPAGFKPWPGIAILYVIVPWIGVMAAGYGFGVILDRDAASRRRLCLQIGLAMTIVFLVAGTLMIKHDARPFVYRLLDQQKYPASQLFLLMTLGPAITLLGLLENAPILETFGRVPMFYYLLHIPTIHIAALIVNLIRSGNAHAGWYASAPFVFVPPPERWSLPLLYLVYVIVIAALYFPCRWFADLRARRGGWLRYI